MIALQPLYQTTKIASSTQHQNQCNDKVRERQSKEMQRDAKSEEKKENELENEPLENFGKLENAMSKRRRSQPSRTLMGPGGKEFDHTVGGHRGLQEFLFWWRDGVEVVEVWFVRLLFHILCFFQFFLFVFYFKISKFQMNRLVESWKPFMISLNAPCIGCLLPVSSWTSVGDVEWTS